MTSTLNGADFEAMKKKLQTQLESDLEREFVEFQMKNKEKKIAALVRFQFVFNFNSSLNWNLLVI